MEQRTVAKPKVAQTQMIFFIFPYIWVKSCRTGKKWFKWPNLTLTPRDVLAKPFILQTWVFYPVGLLSPGHLHKDCQLPGTIFKG